MMTYLSLIPISAYMQEAFTEWNWWPQPKPPIHSSLSQSEGEMEKMAGVHAPSLGDYSGVAGKQSPSAELCLALPHSANKWL